MSSDLITSTMKSEPGRCPSGFTSTSTFASSAIWCAVGRVNAGTLAAPVGGVAALAASCASGTVAAVPATPARNFRRFTLERESFLAIVEPPLRAMPTGESARLTIVEVPQYLPLGADWKAIVWASGPCAAVPPSLFRWPQNAILAWRQGMVSSVAHYCRLFEI